MEKHKSLITLEGKGLSLGYVHQKAKKEILHNLDFQLFRGELTCLLGPNGVGKSTLIKAILGQITPWQGGILLDDIPVHALDTSQLAKRIAVVLTDPVFPGNMTVGQLVALGRTPHTGWLGRLSQSDREIVEKALLATKIADLRDERLSEISDGQRQKAMIARALAQDAPLMILDEPTAHLDLENRLEVMYLLRDIAQNQHKSILIVTHDLDIALETADRFWLMDRAKALVTGIPEDLVLSGAINRLLPGDKFHFSLERGKVQSLSSRRADWIAEGDSTSVFWVKQAMEKANIGTLSEPFFVKSEPFLIRYKGEQFQSLAEFIDLLRSINQIL